jgi:hypothetical protein
MLHLLHVLLSRFRQKRHCAVPRASQQTSRRPLSLEILEDRTVPSGVLANFTVLDNWGTGFEAQLSLVNQQTTPVPNWNLAFDMSASISSIWDATIVSHTGNHYVIGNAGWNSNIAAGAAISFGFIAAPDGSMPGHERLGDRLQRLDNRDEHQWSNAEQLGACLQLPGTDQFHLERRHHEPDGQPLCRGRRIVE